MQNYTQPQLSYSGLGSATTNGSNLSSWATGMSDISLGGNSNAANVGGNSLTAPNIAQPVTPGQTPVGPQQNGPGWFGEHGKLNTIIGGVQTLGSLWNSYQQHKMAKEQMAFAREQWDTNLANQTQTYNTALEDRIRSRHFAEGKDSGQTDAYLKEHSL